MPSEVQQLLQRGLCSQQTGRLAEAEDLYRQVLSHDPEQADALHLLGLVLYQRGAIDEAVALIRQAITHRPDAAEFHLNLGNILAAQRKPGDAVDAYRKAISLIPRGAGTSAIAHSNLGGALAALGRLDEALQAYATAIQLQPMLPEAHCGMGNVLAAFGRLEDAATAFQRAVELRPNYLKARMGLGLASRRLGRFEAAAQAYERATQIAPQDAEAWHELGMSLRALEHDVPAITALRRAAELQPNSVAAWNNLGTQLRECGQLDEALACFHRAFAQGGARAGTCNNLGTAYRDLGRIPEAIESFRQALAADPMLHQAYSNLLMTLHYDCVPPPEKLFAEYVEWSRRYAEPLTDQIRPHENQRDPGRRLRIGYVSADFRTHPIASFVEPIFAAHDRDSVELFCYSSTPHPDDVTARMRSHAQRWHEVARLSDEELAEKIRADRIDILVDLSGHSAHNRLLAFARKPAPVQVTYLGHPDTTGLRTMDYRLTDLHHDPVGMSGMSEHFNSETLVRLPRTAWCYQPWTTRPVAPLPARQRGYVMFGCLNVLAKITPAVIDCWSEILRQVKDSRLMLLVSAAAGEEAKMLRSVFAARGIAADRVQLLARCSPEQYMAAFDQIDISLDPFPYNGLTSTCNSLWMGVPVVTLAGDTHVSRAGVSLLSNVGLPELIADGVEHYQKLAAELAADLDRLEVMRQSLRPRMQASPLRDAKAFTAALERAYREMWRTWLAGHPSVAGAGRGE